MNKKALYIILALLLVIAAVLRLIHPSQIPYTYDELSALNRTHFDSFSELVNKGIIIDAHPAGVQTFLYYWTKLFGYNELVVKLPFIICGILAVYFLFKIGERWFNGTVGLVCAAFLATLQYSILYSQIARPYSSGLFFALAMVYYWDKIIFNPSEKYYKNAALYILFSALCAYNHHFSLLFAAIVGITGLFFMQKKYLLKYIIAGICIFVLYIPHLRIFFYQLHIGGVGGPNGWLGAPKVSFIPDYLKYVFHFSRSVFILVGALIIAGIVLSIKNGFTKPEFFAISLAWFIMPLLIGFWYSVKVNPVLQPSMLLFSFPFLLLSLFCWLPELSLKYTAPVLLLICVINIFTLIHSRKHYTLFYEAPYEQSIRLHDSLIQAMGKNNITTLIQSDDTDKSATEYYVHKDQADTSFFWTDRMGCFITHPSNYTKLSRFMQGLNKPYFAYGCTAQFDPIILPVLLTYYPYVVKKWDFFGGSFYLLSKKEDANTVPIYSFESKNNFEGFVKNWQEAGGEFLCDTVYYSPNHSYKMDSLHEWAPSFSYKLNDMSWGKNDIIEISLEIYPLETMTDVSIVSSIDDNGKTEDWRETRVTNFIPDTLKRHWVKVYHAIKLQDINLAKGNPTVKVYIWNKGRKKFYMDDFTVKTIKGNPVIYGLMQKI